MLVDNRWMGLALAGLALIMPAAAAAQARETPDKPAAQAAMPPSIDPAALAALDKMGTALRALKQFSLTSETSIEYVLESGEKIQLGGDVVYKVRQPNEFFAEVKSDRRQRQFFYDGKDLTVYSPRLKYYATMDGVNASLREMVLGASQDYGIELPLADLFLWGTEYAPRDAIKGASYVGAGTLGGDAIDQYAFRQVGVDWQVWISKVTSLPRKLVITSLDDEARPQYAARLNWDTKKAIPASTFSFVPPKGASKIVFVPVDVAVVEEDAP
ncbi:DUF2092 domain-containing protein [Luteimonas sp. SX5]|uniref:DUF2092 domain-containing protein n=1 Tax=Luteimonas galliterrae TaxID=2940486 RepID=A0ABT0MGI7_9GAMM|nr:DUF2092 domain-containing protein [Luteimonas galliterrae]MCL1633963.1 DUF2092 domain-containing protein [Luteimonas galliterrae]